MKKAFAFVGLALAAALLVPATTQTADIPVAPSATHQVNKDIPIVSKVSYIVREGMPGDDVTAYIVRGKKNGHDIEVQRDIPISPRETAYIVRGFGPNPGDDQGENSIQTAYIVREGLPTGNSVQTAY
ncbi:hypothetical protein, partial [Tumebacillus flagellatus]|uniref:hypothetical protein n=1 Tax=Tumebacillus flagellatus TaxID=1157490 RepID=UPI00056DFA7B